MEKSTNGAKDERETAVPSSVSLSLDPKEDGFYQLGYRKAISDVLYYLSLLILAKILLDLVLREKE